MIAAHTSHFGAVAAAVVIALAALPAPLCAQTGASTAGLALRPAKSVSPR